MYEERSSAGLLAKDRGEGREALPRDDDGRTADGESEKRGRSAGSKTTSSKSRPVKIRNLNLDVLRGIAILMVLGSHIVYFDLWAKIGWAGVDMFFVLSGFLISGLLFDEWQKHGSIRIARFYVRRAFKIYPSFYLLLLVSVPLAWALPGITEYGVNARSLAAEALFLQGYLPNIWGTTWSLAVEEHFYLALPLVLLAMCRCSSRSADPFHAIPALFLLVSVTDAVWRTLGGGWHFVGQWPGMFQTHLRVDALLFGVTLSYYRHFRTDLFREFAQSKAALMVFISAAIFLCVVNFWSPIMHTVGFTVVFCGFGVMLARMIDLRPGRSLLPLFKPIGVIGTYSYSIYLWHPLVLNLLAWAFHRDVPLKEKSVIVCSALPAFALCIGISIALGTIMAKLVEVPALRLRERMFPNASMQFSATVFEPASQVRFFYRRAPFYGVVTSHEKNAAVAG